MTADTLLQLMELKLRSHELEATLGGLGGPIRAFAGLKGGTADTLPAQSGSSQGGGVGQDMLSSMAALKQRQEQYMQAC